MDMAVFGQTLLNGGSYRDARVLGRHTVSEMTRNQIPGIGADYTRGEQHVQRAEALWGYGWCIAGDEKWPGWPTFTKGTFSHGGAGGLILWVDQAREIVGVYLSVCRYRPTGAITNVDLFVNAVTAAIED
jgi:CubicO group peptidase (beta-lactamase class C family)